MNEILVQSAAFHAGDKAFPDARVSSSAQWMTFSVPLIEAADHGNPIRVRRPDREISALLAADSHQIRTHFFVEPAVAAFVEKIKILVAQEGNRRQTLLWILPTPRCLDGFLAHDRFTP